MDEPGHEGDARSANGDAARTPDWTPRIVLDLRATTGSIQKQLVLSFIDLLVDMDAVDDLVLVCDHDATALAFALDIRRETRGLFEYDVSTRSDGAWVCFVRRRARTSDR